MARTRCVVTPVVALTCVLACSNDSEGPAGSGGDSTTTRASVSGTATGVGGTSTGAGGTSTSGGASSITGSTGATASAAGGAAPGVTGSPTTGSATTGSATTGEAGGSSVDEDQLLFVPDGLANPEEPGGEGGLTLTAFTLAPGEHGLELFVAVSNEGDTPSCEAGITTTFLDRAGEFLTSASSELWGRWQYRLNDGSDVIIDCIPPGEVAMAASTNLPDDLSLDDLGSLSHRFPAFVVEGIVPVEGLVIDELRGGDQSGTSYAGTFVNTLDVPVRDPSVAVFPVTQLGRPLGVAMAAATLEVAPGESWTFETTAVRDPGTGSFAFPAATVP